MGARSHSVPVINQATWPNSEKIREANMTLMQKGQKLNAHPAKFAGQATPGGTPSCVRCREERKVFKVFSQKIEISQKTSAALAALRLCVKELLLKWT